MISVHALMSVTWPFRSSCLPTDSSSSASSGILRAARTRSCAFRRRPAEPGSRATPRDDRDRVIVDRQIPRGVGGYGMRDGMEAGIEVSRRPGISRSDQCRPQPFATEGGGWRVRRPDEAGEHGDARSRRSNPRCQCGTDESRMHQRRLDTTNLATQPKATGDPSAPFDTAEFDSLLAQDILDPGPSIVKVRNFELEAASLQKRHELRERALCAAGTESVDHNENPHGNGPADRYRGAMRS